MDLNDGNDYMPNILTLQQQRLDHQFPQPALPVSPEFQQQLPAHTFPHYSHYQYFYHYPRQQYLPIYYDPVQQKHLPVFYDPINQHFFPIIYDYQQQQYLPAFFDFGQQMHFVYGRHHVQYLPNNFDPYLQMVHYYSPNANYPMFQQGQNYGSNPTVPQQPGPAIPTHAQPPVIGQQRRRNPYQRPRPRAKKQKVRNQPIQVQPPPLLPLPANIPAVVANQIYSFKTHDFITFPPSLRNFIQGFVLMPGRIYKEELIVRAEIGDYMEFCPVGSYYFDYTYLCKRTLDDVATPTPPLERFIRAIPYEGKGGTKHRHLEHLDEILDHEQGKGKKKTYNMNKIIALNDILTSRDGFIIQVNNTFSSEHLAFNHEGGIIKLLYEQLSNDRDGDFPGMEVDKNNFKLSADSGQKQCKPRKFVVPSNAMENFGFQTLVRAFLSYEQQQHFVITKANYKNVIKARDHKIQAVFDQNNAYSKYNLVQRDFSNFLNGLLNGTSDINETLYNSVWESKFRKVIPQNCHVFVIFDGATVPDLAIDKASDYTGIPDVRDDLIAGFNFGLFLNAVVAIGIENNFNTFYTKMLNSVNGVSYRSIPLK